MALPPFFIESKANKCSMIKTVSGLQICKIDTELIMKSLKELTPNCINFENKEQLRSNYIFIPNLPNLLIDSKAFIIACSFTDSFFDKD
jgi:hypothetical protein